MDCFSFLLRDRGGAAARGRGLGRRFGLDGCRALGRGLAPRDARVSVSGLVRDRRFRVRAIGHEHPPQLAARLVLFKLRERIADRVVREDRPVHDLAGRERFRTRIARDREGRGRVRRDRFGLRFARLARRQAGNRADDAIALRAPLIGAFRALGQVSAREQRRGPLQEIAQAGCDLRRRSVGRFGRAGKRVQRALASPVLDQAPKRDLDPQDVVVERFGTVASGKHLHGNPPRDLLCTGAHRDLG